MLQEPKKVVLRYLGIGQFLNWLTYGGADVAIHIPKDVQVLGSIHFLQRLY